MNTSEIKSEHEELHMAKPMVSGEKRLRRLARREAKKALKLDPVAGLEAALARA